MEQHSDVFFLSSFAVAAPKRLESSAFLIPETTNSYRALTDTNLFSSSQPDLPYLKLNFADSEHSGQSIENNLAIMNKLNDKNSIKDPLEDVDPSAIGNLLPDDEERVGGIEDDFDLSALPSQLEDLDDDLFDSGGGMEMDFDFQGTLSTGISKINISEGVPINGSDHYAIPSGVGMVSGEHPLGEHPSRTLFVRNINSNVEDTELRALFGQYGDIRNLYTSCKHRGFVMISYYDIRAARTAMRALQNKPLRRRKLDIHFSIPKDNPSEKDINQGTLVIFNLDASVSNDELRRIFGAYGEVKEIRETPHKRHHKFIEYYDVRAAEEALKALNRSDIAGKRIKLEPSRPGGARRNLLQQLSQDMEPDEARNFFHHVGSPVTNSSPGNWGHFGSPVNRNSSRSFSMSPCHGSASPVQSNHLPGLASILPSPASNSVKMAPIDKDHGGSNTVNHVFLNTGSAQGSIYQQSSSFPKRNSGARTGPIAFGESDSTISAMETLYSHQFLWSSPKYSEPANSSSWASSSMDHSLTSSGQVHGFQYPIRHGSFLDSPHRVGSAPSGVPLDRHFEYLLESPKASFLSPVQLRGIALDHSSGNSKMNISSRANAGLPVKMTDNCSPSYRAMSLPMHGIVFPGNGTYHGPGLTVTGTMAEREQSWRVDGNAIQADTKKQYQLDLDKIISGEDARTTLMIKNIPNKYTSKMLLAAIDESHRGSYDFLYLPIDFKNKCNVGYAFINMLSPSHVVSFHKAFNGKNWEKFNSEKVASLAYARIQGKAALVAHFQNSSLMNEDKRCRPIVFHSEGEELGAHESLFSSNLNICIRQPDGSYTGDLLESPIATQMSIHKKN